MQSVCRRNQTVAKAVWVVCLDGTAMKYLLLILLCVFSYQHNANAQQNISRAPSMELIESMDIPIFNITFEEFKNALNREIQNDTPKSFPKEANTINTCKKDKNGYVCNFHNAGFMESINSMKALNVINGRFSLKTFLVITIQKEKISRITIIGDRGDPVNWMQFLGYVLDIMEIFDPGITASDSDLHNITEELGLEHGDMADDIGKIHSYIANHEISKCITQDLHTTTQVACQFDPRS